MRKLGELFQINRKTIKRYIETDLNKPLIQERENIERKQNHFEKKFINFIRKDTLLEPFFMR